MPRPRPGISLTVIGPVYSPMSNLSSRWDSRNSLAQLYTPVELSFNLSSHLRIHIASSELLLPVALCCWKKLFAPA